MTFRKIIFWIHLIIGVCAGLVVLVMSVTGVLLTYDRQISAQEIRAYRITEVDASTPRLSEKTLLRGLEDRLAADKKVTSLTVFSEPSLPVLASLSRSETLFVDPYSGAVLGESRADRVFYFVMGVHRTLALHLVDRWEAGTVVTGLCNAAFLILLLSGLYLWIPRKWSRQSVRAVIWFNGNRGRQRDWNWHHVFGLWLSPVLLVLIISGVFISYGGLYDVVGKVVGDQAPNDPSTRGDPTARTLDEMWADARAYQVDWTAIQMRYPGRRSPNLRFAIRSKPAGYPDSWTNLDMDPQTGQRVAISGYADHSPVRKFRSWMRWLHTGEALGVVGQTLAGLGSLAGVILVWTGLALAWRRFIRWRKRRQRGRV